MYPGFMLGVNPKKIGKTVKKKVCFQEGNNCCAKKVFVKVKRCPKDFLIYQLPAAPSGSYRYCGSKRRETPTKVPITAPPVKTGEDKDHPGKSCKVIKELNSQGGTGLYWINPSGGKAFRAYCDQETDGGGWTLVYSYTFTNYPNFVDGSNAVTPRPSWPAVGDIPISKKVPLKETQLGAMDFKFWRQIGNEFMVKSNINHWIACKEVNGSLVDYKAGSLSCKVIKNVASVCPNVAPDEIRVLTKESSANYGPHLYYSKSTTELRTYYYWESSTQTGNWPTHDPCGKNGLYHVKNVVNPHGNIFIR
ncbi:Veficolin-1 [Stylophora pistillata]|uniref:Veficolin-1 n=2 Tax=Stylophora pistillata TaxID=50429 RepID=A0A2B4SQE4_STYPI|nr:Veficolin-1 [Stylophora pistillata]